MEPCLPVSVVQSFMQDALEKCGVPKNDAQICADVLITSDLRGIESHGIGRLRMYCDRLRKGLQSPITKLTVIRESPTTTVIDANNGMGMVTGVKSMDIAIQKAKRYGMGSVAVRNSTHFGIDGYYPLMAVKADMIGMSYTNARPAVAPTYGTQPTLGTNPIAFGAPTDEDFPFLFDAATSITQRGKVEVLSREEKPIPSTWVIDKDGNAAYDPDDVLEGLSNNEVALLPLGGAGEMGGGHKGYGLSTMVEILSASLQGGAYLLGLKGFDHNGNPIPFKTGHFFMAINIESFTSLDEFKSTTGNILRQLRNTRKQPGCDRIYTAGEKEYEKEKQVRKDGVLINLNLQKDLLFLRNELDLHQYKFPF